MCHILSPFAALNPQRQSSLVSFCHDTRLCMRGEGGAAGVHWTRLRVPEITEEVLPGRNEGVLLGAVGRVWQGGLGDGGGVVRRQYITGTQRMKLVENESEMRSSNMARRSARARKEGLGNAAPKDSACECEKCCNVAPN